MKRSEDLFNATLPDNTYWLKQIAVGIAQLTEATLESVRISNAHLEYFKKYHCPEEPAEIASDVKEQPQRSNEVIVEEVNCECGHPVNCHGRSGCMVKTNDEYCECFAQGPEAYN